MVSLLRLAAYLDVLLQRGPSPEREIDGLGKLPESSLPDSSHSHTQASLCIQTIKANENFCSWVHLAEMEVIVERSTHDIQTTCNLRCYIIPDRFLFRAFTWARQKHGDPLPASFP
ncbi:unnamed protein product [Leuciscus chuanchicus]